MSKISEENSFLAEGYDFIEEGLDVNSEPLTFTEVTEDIIVESEGSTPHQYKILGKASGVFQSVGGFSRNNRRYLPEHWKIQLDKPIVKERLAQRDYMGTIGHHDHPVLDSEIAQGLVSHLLSKLEIREDKNGKPFLYGEIEILDTPAGRILKAMYEGGASIFVSSRAAGKLRPVPGQTYQEVDPVNYHFEGFDIVRRAGFPVAKPVYEEVKNEVVAKSVNENQINELDDKTIESDLDKRQDQMYDAAARAKENPKAAAEAKKKYEKALDLAQKEAERNEKIIDQDDRGHHVHISVREDEIKGLQSQINQLAKILEKVVDDVYEEEAPKEDTPEGAKEKEMEKKPEEAPQQQEQPIAPVQEDKANKKELRKAVIPAFLKIVAESNISEKALSEIIEMIKGDLK